MVGDNGRPSRGRPEIGPASSVRLGEYLAVRADARAAVDGVKRADVIRRALEFYLEPDAVIWSAGKDPDYIFDVHTVPWHVIEAVLYSEEELDGIWFDEADGATVMYFYGGGWTLNLFLLGLAHAMGPVIAPDLKGYKQIYRTFSELTIDMPLPVPAPKFTGFFSVRLPNIRIEGLPSD